ncbi:MAG TPA: FCD domain-containing protein [Acetobacteraceae bacterium]
MSIVISALFATAPFTFKSRKSAISIRMSPAPKGGLAGFVERSLHQALLEGHLRPGERLVTRELAEQLGTSLTPVREALLKLVAAGALEIGPSQSFRVPLVTVARYLEISDIRRAVEGLAAERATARIEPQQIEALRTIKDRFLTAKGQFDVAQALAHNYAFRFGLYEIAGMPALLDVIERLWLQIGPALNYLYPQPVAVSERQHNYDRLLAALERRDGTGVRAAIDRAIDEGNDIVLTNLQNRRLAMQTRQTSAMGVP